MVIGQEFQAHPELLSDSTLVMIKRAKARLAQLAPQLAQICELFDAMLSVSCGILAPVGLEATGPSDFIKFWGAFGLPQVNLPLARGEGELPAGLQAIGAFRGDGQLLITAQGVVDALVGPMGMQVSVLFL